MRAISAIADKARFGQLLDAAERAPVTVTRKSRPAAVVMSVGDYERLRGSACPRPCRSVARAPPS
jgi:prevent-host-death family protein